MSTTFTTSHSEPGPSTPLASPPADVPETAVASTDAPTQDASTRAQPADFHIHDRAYEALMEFRNKEEIERAAQRAAEAERRVTERNENRLRMRELFRAVLTLDVPLPCIQGYAKDDEPRYGFAEATLDDVRFRLGWREHGRGGAYHLFVVAPCVRLGCVHQEELVRFEVNGWCDLGAALETIYDEGGAVHTHGDCTDEDWGA